MNNTSVRILLAAAVLFAPTVAFGWDGTSHSVLATAEFSDPVVARLASLYLTSDQISQITSFTGEPPTPYHHPDNALYTGGTSGYQYIPAGEWHGIFQQRLYASSSFSLWPELDEATKLKYLLHLGNDSGVPVDHSPAGEVYSGGGLPETTLEGQTGNWGSSSYPTVTSTNRTATFSYNYPAVGNGISSISFSYVGAYSQVWQAQYDAVRANATWFMGRPNIYGLYKSTGDNYAAATVGTTQAEMFVRAFLVDYFQAKGPTAGTTYTVAPGGFVTLNAAGSPNPDSITGTWDSNANYTNGVRYDWDLNGDGVYGDVTGEVITLSYSQLMSLVGVGEGKTIYLRATDGAGSIGYASATLNMLIPEPGTLMMLLGAALALVGTSLARCLGQRDSSLRSE